MSPDKCAASAPDRDLVLPCRDEEAALRDLLPRLPSDFAVIVVDDGSSDGSAALAVGRRRPVSRGVWPWHARLGNQMVVWLLRRRGFAAHDIAPIRVTGCAELLDLDVRHRRSDIAWN